MSKSSLRLRRRATLSLLVASVACASGTGPDGGADTAGTGAGNTDTGIPGKTHPAGTVSDRITFDAGLLRIAVSSSGVAYVSNVFSGALVGFSTQAPYAKLSSVVTGDGALDIAIDRTGSTAYVGSGKGKVYVVDLVAGTLKTTLSASGDTYGLALAPDESRVFVTGPGRIWSVPIDGAPPTAGSAASYPFRVTVSPSGGALYVTNMGSGEAARVDPSTLATTSRISGTFATMAVAVAPRGDEVYVGTISGNGTGLYALDPSTMATRGTMTIPNQINWITVSPDGKQIYVAIDDGTLAIFDRATRNLLSQRTLGGNPSAIAFDSTGATAFVVNFQGWVDVIR
jgi:DNA-binding beta-propeller fold protein YncE